MFLFRLAAHQGKSIGELLDSTPSRELTEWMVYDRYFPIADGWQQTGILSALLCNLLSSGPKRKPEDFIPAAKPPGAEQSAADQVAIMQSLAARRR
ncbi:MAG: hypothetical protein JWM16_6197 [Verrucomicrobiales bacterium]|nr:hypothetical protein [Verrucomicrobiales bacterium]